MKTLIFSILCFLSISLWSQDNYVLPNLDQIEKETQNKNSDFYFSKLMDRFEKGDSTMTLLEKHHLYYGYTFQEAYSPYNRLTDVIGKINEIHIKENLNEVDLKNLIDFSNTILKDFPFDLGALENKVYAYEELDDQKNLTKTITQANIILDAVFSTGNGREPSSAFHVIDVRNEYSVLNILGFNFGGNQALIEESGHFYDKLTLAENQYEIPELYFDICSSYNSLAF